MIDGFAHCYVPLSCRYGVVNHLLSKAGNLVDAALVASALKFGVEKDVGQLASRAPGR